jgi:hypothetical protein
MKKMTVSALLMISLVCASFLSYGLRPPPRRPGNGTPPGQQNVPFDGGASLLIAAGVAYGLKKAYDRRKNGS